MVLMNFNFFVFLHFYIDIGSHDSSVASFFFEVFICF